MSSTGTTIERSHDFSAGGATTRTSCEPPRKAATRSGGRTVADRPIRCRGCCRDEDSPIGLGERLEPLQRQSEVGSALGPGKGVHLVDDHRSNRSEQITGGRSQHQEQ